MLLISISQFTAQGRKIHYFPLTYSELSEKSRNFVK